MSETVESESFLSQFPPEEVVEDRLDFNLGPDGRCIQKFLLYKNRVVWFSIVQQTRSGGEWFTVVRADTCHDEAHLHRFTRRRGESDVRHSICDLNTIDDVEAGFDHASDLITEDWEENVRRWAR